MSSAVLSTTAAPFDDKTFDVHRTSHKTSGYRDRSGRRKGVHAVSNYSGCNSPFPTHLSTGKSSGSATPPNGWQCMLFPCDTVHWCLTHRQREFGCSIVESKSVKSSAHIVSGGLLSLLCNKTAAYHCYVIVWVLCFCFIGSCLHIFLLRSLNNNEKEEND